ncbi:FecR domain-containing protein [Polynucleobacter sp. MWH-UH25E]|uniref:FecR family protein n=1 Tax=Polynucleobacter sp. MWH-UH25E TaxID=1855616 RepID=UPI001BFD275F|nr:FecR family protein [Polynucleobacter sp. MWH-UH25E]QWD61819.1 FecR domain-containing protein [Polynucleobacter sp. MWH-UH25E]
MTRISVYFKLHQTRMLGIVLLLLIAMIHLGNAQAQTPAAAGKVLMAIGDVKAMRGGQAIALAKGADILAGDAVVTGIASNAQLRMSDGAVIALRAQSEFKINQYNFNGKTDGSEKAELSLVKGGVRAVTGAIGRENKDNLQINAVVATVGIRGTGFNINVCEGNCFNPDKTPVKDGLYAGVFEGKIVVKNQVSVEAVGVNQYLYVSDKDTKPQFIIAPPNFLPDPLTGQKSAKPKGRSDAVTEIPSLAVAVSAPSKSADAQVPVATSALPNVTGVTVTQPPALAASTNAFVPSQLYNDPGLGNGLPVQANAGYAFYLQKAETYPAGTLGSDGLPPHNILPDSNPVSGGVTLNAMAVTPSATSGQTAYMTQIGLDPNVYHVTGTNIPVTYAIGTAQQIEGGNLNNVVSWGRWANGDILQIAGYNSGGPVTIPAGNGFHYIVGDRTSTANLNQFVVNGSVLNFALLAATTPTPVGASQGTWSVTSGSMTANFASAQLSGNLGMFNTQSSGYGIYNMTFSGGLSPSAASNTISTNVMKTAGSLNLCAAGCAGSGNITFYGGGAVNPSLTPAQAAGMSYNFNTGNNVVQGVAVFKR